MDIQRGATANWQNGAKLSSKHPRQQLRSVDSENSNGNIGPLFRPGYCVSRSLFLAVEIAPPDVDDYFPPKTYFNVPVAPPPPHPLRFIPYRAF